MVIVVDAASSRGGAASGSDLRQLCLVPRIGAATMSIDWQPPSELPDLRRVGELALDTEPKDDGLQADRGSGWPWHGGLHLRSEHRLSYRQRYSPRTIFRSVIPTVKILIPRNCLRGSKIWLRPMYASSPRTACTIGDGCTPTPASKCSPPSAWKRSMRSPPWRTKPAGNTVLMRYAPGAAFLAKTRHCCTKDVLHSG